MLSKFTDMKLGPLQGKTPFQQKLALNTTVFFLEIFSKVSEKHLRLKKAMFFEFTSLDVKS